MSCTILLFNLSLLKRKNARVVIRPMLQVNGTPVTLSVLEDIRLRITSTDQDGVATTKEVKDFKLLEDRESDYEFQLDRMFGNPAPPPDSYATITVEGDDSLKINKYLASDEQIAWYSFGRLEAPAAGDAIILQEFTVKINAADTAPDGNDFTGVIARLGLNRKPLR